MRISCGSFHNGISAIGSYYLHRLGDPSLHRLGDLAAKNRLRGPVNRHYEPTLTAQPVAHGVRDAVYEFILGNLSLSPLHVVDLMRRGLDEETIVRNLYATATASKKMTEIIEALPGRIGLTEANVPGIHRSKNTQWTIPVEPGDLLIPVRDAGWRILAIMRRCNDQSSRYRWVSCHEAPSGAPVHHAEPWNAEFRHAIYITEGQIKADVIAAKLGFTTIGLPGCTSIPAGLVTQLRADYPNVHTVFVAFDADVQTNRSVARGRERLENALLDGGYRVHRVEWNVADGKGLDDVLSSAVCA